MMLESIHAKFRTHLEQSVQKFTMLLYHVSVIMSELCGTKKFFCCDILLCTTKFHCHLATLDLDRPMINASNLNPEEGENVTLSCTANASPDFEAKNGDFVWTHNTDYISSGSVLVLENINHSASGTYQCTATNMASAQSSSVILSVSCEYLFTLFFFGMDSL